jgi:phosphoglycerate dehydrogenase-like enzyme
VGAEILPESIARADYVSLHTPLTQETSNMIGAKELGLMKKSAFLVNVARAPVVDREALFTVLWMILLECLHFCC